MPLDIHNVNCGKAWCFQRGIVRVPCVGSQNIPQVINSFYNELRNWDSVNTETWKIVLKSLDVCPLLFDWTHGVG